MNEGRAMATGPVWSDRDRVGWLTVFALVVAVAALGLWVVGVPTVDLHSPLHFVGIMDPFCGGTRATYLLVSGDPGQAARYNPGIFAFALVVVAVVIRAAIGVLTGHWFDITLTRRWRRVAQIGFFVAVAVLWVRQQANADLLTRPWPTT